MQSNRYTIHTENKNLEAIENILKGHISTDSFTIIPVIGSYNGVNEQAIKIEIVTLSVLDNWLRDVCKRIKVMNNQAIVLLTKERVEAALI